MAERTLRITSLISSLFAIPLLVPATIISAGHRYSRWNRIGDSVIGFCFIPLAFTFVTSLTYLIRARLHKKRAASSLSTAPPAAHPVLWAAADFAIFAGYLIALVFEWVKGIYRLHGFPDTAFAEAYATVPIMLNMVIHAFIFLIFNLRPAFRALIAASKSSRECPHCHHRIGGSCVDEVAQKGSGEGYSLLRGEEYDDDAARASSSSEDRAALPAVEEV